MQCMPQHAICMYLHCGGRGGGVNKGKELPWEKVVNQKLGLAGVSPQHITLTTTIAIGATPDALLCCVAHSVSPAGTTSVRGTLRGRAGPVQADAGAGGAELGLSWLRGRNVSMATEPAPPQRVSLASVLQATGGQPKPTSWRNWGTDQRLLLHQITSSPGPWAAAEPELAGKVGQSPEAPSPPCPRMGKALEDWNPEDVSGFGGGGSEL